VRGELQVTALTEATCTHLQELLLLSIRLRPDGSGMGPESEQKTDDVGEEEQCGCEPRVRLDRFVVETVVQCRGLRVVTSAAVPLGGTTMREHTLAAI